MSANSGSAATEIGRRGDGGRLGRGQGDVGVGEQQGDGEGDAAGHGEPP